MRPETLALLGLEVDAAPRTVELANGIVLTYRPPTGLDYSRAGQRASAALAAARALDGAIDRYGLTAADLGALTDPEVWEGVAAFLGSVELGAIIVSDITRTGPGPDGKPGTWTVPVTPAALSAVLRHEGSLDAFMKATQQAAAEFIRPKKE